MALLFALPAWVVWDGQASVAFVALAPVTSLLPDVDLVLSALFPAVFAHHGVTHTVLFVALVSVGGGAAVAMVLDRHLDARTRVVRAYRSSAFRFVTAAFLLGGLSHLVADMLSAPDVAPPVEPFWPFLSKPWSVDVVWYSATWVNFGFLVAVGLCHLALFALLDPFESRSRAAEGDP